MINTIDISVPIRGGEELVRCNVDVGFTEEVKGDEGTGVYYADDVTINDIPIGYGEYRAEIEEELDRMLSNGELEAACEDQADDPPEVDREPWYPEMEATW